jgi:tetratricopeptide (TPR) repeat protein
MTEEQLEAAWPTLAPKQQLPAIEQLIAAGRLETADRLLARTRYPHAGDQMIRDFYVGMVRKDQGRTKEAVAIFREILSRRPEFTRVRLELAHALMVAEEDESARHHFELALGAAGSNPAIEQAIRSHIAAIDSRKTWDFTGYMTLAPSTNLNQGSERAVIYLNGLPFQLAEANRKRSGVGFIAGFNAGYRHPLADRLDLLASIGVQAKRYKVEDFNDLIASLTVGPRYRFDWGTLGLFGLVEKRWMADEEYSTSLGGLLSASVRLGAQNMAFADLTCSDRAFERDWRKADLSYQDGYACSASGRIEHYFDSRTFFRLLGAWTHEQTGRRHLDNTGWQIGAGLYRELDLAISVYGEARYTRKAHDGVYPGATVAREDDRYDVSLQVTKRDWQVLGFAPMLQYTYTVNDSTIGFHTYDAHGVNLTLTKKY